METIIKTLNSSNTLNPTPWETIFRWRDTEPIKKIDSSGKPIDKLYIKGTNILLEAHERPRVAIIGTRTPSPYGIECAKKIVDALSWNKRKPIIISGLALGIDNIAHRAALNNGLATVAVLPTGLDTIYPYLNRSLAEDILKSKEGCLLAQFPEKTTPTAINFLSRNAVIAALSDIVIVVESKAKGGAIVTARYAHEFGADILAVPGRVDDIWSQGCNDLIRQNIAEILNDFSILENI